MSNTNAEEVNCRKWYFGVSSFLQIWSWPCEGSCLCAADNPPAKSGLIIPSASLIKKWHMSVITWPLSILTLGDGHFCHMKLGVWIFGGRYLWLLVSSLHIFSSCLHLSSMLWNHHWPYLHSPIGTKGWKIHIMLKIQLNWVKIAKQEFENTSVLQLCVCECIYMAKIDIPQFADDLLK